LALLLLMAAPGSAEAKARTAKFKMTVTGEQTSTWARDQMTVTDSESGCGIHTVRNGSERVAFATSRPVTVRARPRRFGSFTVPNFIFASTHRATFVAGATVDRAVTDNSKDTCTGQPYPPDPPFDCGRRQVTWFLTLASDYRRSGGVWIGFDPTRQPDGAEDVFKSCQQGLFEWPQMQDHDPNGTRTWVGAVSNGRFFNRRAKRIVVRANHAWTGDPQTSTYTSASVHLSWTLVLKRLRK
jgi:hypothetical protein